MKKQLWQKAIVGTLLTTSLATPIALAQTTDSLNMTSAGQAQLVDHRGEGGKGWHAGGKGGEGGKTRRQLRAAERVAAWQREQAAERDAAWQREQGRGH